MAWTEITRPKYQRDGRPSARGRVRYASKRYHGRGVVIDRATPAAACDLRSDARDQHARGGQCRLLYRAEWLPVAPAAEEFPALHNGAAAVSYTHLSEN